MSAELGRHYHDFAAVTGGIAEIYLYEARFDDALVLLNASVLALVKMDSKGTEWARLQIQRAGIMRYKGYCHHDPSLYDQALTILSSIMSVVKASGDKALLADALDLTGLALHSKEPNLDSSLARRLGYFEQALELRQAINDARGMAQSHFHIGLVYQSKRQSADDDRQKAFASFQKAYELAQEGGFRFEQAHAARHLAYAYDKQGEPDRAYACHKEFLETNEIIGFKPYLSPANVMVGLAHYKRGELGEAAGYFRTAYGLASEMGSKPFLADACLMLGVTAAAQGDKEVARKRLEEALSFARPIEFTRVINIASREINKAGARGPGDGSMTMGCFTDRRSSTVAGRNSVGLGSRTPLWERLTRRAWIGSWPDSRRQW